MRELKISVLITVTLCILGCQGEGPNNPGSSERPLAGGGRFSDNDPFTGGPEDSGPRTDDSLVNWPPGDPFEPEFDYLFVWERDCSETPETRVIRTSEDWAAWWAAHNSCVWWYDCSGDSTGVIAPIDSLHPGDTLHPDTSNCEHEPPPVDFDHESVIAISIEYDSGSFCWRSVWITDVEATKLGATISYEVTRLDSTCCQMLMMPMLLVGGSPVIAVRVPETIGSNVVWNRHDTSYSCYWEPDPDEPIALYYTDSDCESGDSEQLITDSNRWNEWYHQAWACDSARWSYYFVDSGGVVGPNGDSIPGDPGTEPSWPYWIPEVNFATHAVIILRSGEQIRWGGGVWLNAIDRSTDGTTFDYTAMQPGEDCPSIDTLGESINPTVAIRIPLPTDPPIIWDRHTEIINCDWGIDSTWADGSGGTGP